MAIFVHFFNREAYRAAGAAYDVNAILKAIRILSIARSDELLTNYANLSEGELLTNGLIRGLLQREILLIEGERATFEEFLESRTARYGFDQLRYPMYFLGKPSAGLVPWRVRSASATDYIAGEVIAVDAHEKGLSQLQLLGTDLKTLRSVLPDVVRIVRDRGERAITRSLFESQHLAPTAQSATTRLIAISYIRRHVEALGATIATGLSSLGVFDHLGSGGWGLDLRLLSLLLGKTGMRWHDSPNEESDHALIALRGSSEQVVFSHEILRICRALELAFDHAPFNERGGQVVSILGSLPQSKRVPLPSSPNDLLVQACVSARLLTNSLRNANSTFAAMHEKVLHEQSQKTLLLLTATKVETQALFEVLERYVPKGMVAAYLPKNNYVAADHGQVAGIRILSVQCEAGSVGTANAQAVVSDAIRDFRPNWIIMGGIAFGMQPKKQGLGDLLVSKQLVEYEKAKLKEGTELARGARKESSPKLLSLFRAAESSKLTHVPVHVGTLLSGEKLSDDPAFVEARLALEPEAIGGEMEGAGLAASADRENVPWIMVKAIVDWGQGKSNNNSEDVQRAHALEAFSFILRAVVEVGL